MSFDPWGNRRDYHVPWMNDEPSHLFDPVIARFFSPDPYVQMPENTQNYNRYSYCLNNPMNFTDPSGEYTLGFLSGFIRGLFQGENPFKTGHQTGMNELKILGGLFVPDKNKNFGEQSWEVISRFTWQAPQTIVGNIFSNISNWGWQVDKAKYKYGATVLSGNFFGSGGAVTLGSYINGSRSLVADANNSLFQHEYGHYLQSQASGPFYLQRYGIPSALSKGDHDYHTVEQDANIRAFKYFNKHISGYNNWRFDVNPIIGYNESLSFDNPSNQSALKHAQLRTAWYDWALGPNIIPNGIFNALILNNRDLYYSKLRNIYFEGLPIETGAWNRF